MEQKLRPDVADGQADFTPFGCEESDGGGRGDIEKGELLDIQLNTLHGAPSTPREEFGGSGTKVDKGDRSSATGRVPSEGVGVG